MEEKKVPCSLNELEKVENMFGKAIQEKLTGKNLNLDKIIKEFDNLLKMNIEIQPSIQDDQESQELKNKIESRQQKALRIKNSLITAQTSFIDNIRLQIERSLAEKAPTIVDLTEAEGNDTDLKDDHDIEFNARLDILDECILNMKALLSETSSKIQIDGKRYESQAKNIEYFLKKL